VGVVYNWFAGRQQTSQKKILIVQEFLEDQRKGPPSKSSAFAKRKYATQYKKQF
jgi:hypothetical protein